jgi:hypothetical protein
MLSVAGCESDNSAFQTSGTSNTANSGTISQNNFSLLTADVAPGVIDVTTGIFTKTSVELTISIGDRNNQLLTDAHTINFISEYGLVDPSCVTKDGECKVTWTAIKRPDAIGPGSDGRTTITAYTSGEEGFIDTNGNNVYDDGDARFDDIEEPFVDADENGMFNDGDVLIDVISTNDSTGLNQMHDSADGFFNGSGCQHTSLCADRKEIIIFDSVSMNLINGVLSRTIGGNITGLLGTGLVLQNNAGNDLTIVPSNSVYTFATLIEDGLTYEVTVFAQPGSPAQICTVANPTGTVSANVTNANVTCATNTFTVGGNVTNFPPGGGTVTLRINGAEDINIGGNGTYVFPSALADTSPYSVIIESGSATCSLSNSTGNLSGANVINVDLSC